jgi:hypothetical protein
MQIGRVRICASAPAIGQSPSELAQQPPSPLILIRYEMNFCMGRDIERERRAIEQKASGARGFGQIGSLAAPVQLFCAERDNEYIL